MLPHVLSDSVRPPAPAAFVRKFLAGLDPSHGAFVEACSGTLSTRYFKDPASGKLGELLDVGSNPAAELCPGASALDLAIRFQAIESFEWLLAEGNEKYIDSALSPTHHTVLSARASSITRITAWGEAFGTFLGRYRFEKGAPKHVSPTCCVIFAMDLHAVDSFTARPVSSDVSGTSTFYANIQALFSDKEWSLDDADKMTRFWAAIKNNTEFAGLKISVSKQEHVVLKFMHDTAALERELASRKGGLQNSTAVVSILGHCTAADHADFAKDLRDFEQVRLSTEPDGTPTKLDLLLVMERGASDLSDVISHGNFAGKNMHAVRGVAFSIAQCLREMNQPATGPGTMHGDVKNRNFVLLGPFKYGAIDLDAAATIDPTRAANTTGAARAKYLAGQKATSSGCLPPEQAAVVLHSRLRRRAAVFAHLSASQAGLPEDAGGLSAATLERFYAAVGMPSAEFPDFASLDEDGDNLVSQDKFNAFFTDLVRVPVYVERLDQYMVTHGLSFTPLDPVVASMAYDMWCFGVMLYELATGLSLFRWDNDEEVDDPELAKIAAWLPAVKQQSLARVTDKTMRRLLGHLLEKDPAARPESWDDVIGLLNPNNAADSGKIEELLEGMEGRLSKKIEDLSQQLIKSTEQLAATICGESASMKQLMLDLERVKAPYLFEVVPFVPGDPEDGEPVAGEDVSGGSGGGDVLAVLARRGRGLLRRAKESAQTVAKFCSQPAKAAADYIEKRTTSRVELRLLCGVTLEVIVKYEIVKPNEEVVKLAAQGSKMMRYGLMVAAGWNCAAGVGSVFGLPLPKVSQSATGGVKEAQVFLDELLEGESALEAAEAAAAGGQGMDLQMMQAFAAYLEKLESKREAPSWTTKLFPVEDPVVKGRLTWVSAEQCGRYGGTANNDGHTASHTPAADTAMVNEPGGVAGRGATTPGAGQTMQSATEAVAPNFHDLEEEPRVLTMENCPSPFNPTAAQPPHSDALIRELQKMLAVQATVATVAQAQAQAQSQLAKQAAAVQTILDQTAETARVGRAAIGGEPALSDAATPLRADLTDDAVAQETQPAALVPDKDRPACANCLTRFTVTRRRHHCRVCGEIFCNTCSAWRLQLSWSVGGSSRACEACHSDEQVKVAQRALARAARATAAAEATLQRTKELASAQRLQATGTHG